MASAEVATTATATTVPVPAARAGLGEICLCLRPRRGTCKRAPTQPSHFAASRQWRCCLSLARKHCGPRIVGCRLASRPCAARVRTTRWVAFASTACRNLPGRQESQASHRESPSRRPLRHGLRRPASPGAASSSGAAVSPAQQRPAQATAPVRRCQPHGGIHGRGHPLPCLRRRRAAATRPTPATTAAAAPPRRRSPVTWQTRWPRRDRHRMRTWQPRGRALALAGAVVR